MTLVTAMGRTQGFALLLLPLLLLTGCPVDAIGGEMATLSVPLMSNNVSFRQDVCGRYGSVLNVDGVRDLRKGLDGMHLNVIVGAYGGSFFNYDDLDGIDPTDPGIVADLLDELGRRANFTWRQSFGIYRDPADFNATWDELLHWSVDTYDVSVDYWYHSLKRMNDGVAFVEEWYDASPILIGKEADPFDEEIINPWNWLKPYDIQVWMMTLFTIFLSAVVYQILEWYAGDRQERSMWDWWQENAYLSFLNFTQAYEYQPTTFSSRLFGISMAIWALVMTATYTANLASLLVDRKDPVPPSETFQEIAFRQQKVCTWENTLHDQVVQDLAPDVIRIPKQTPLEMFQALESGECDFLVESVAGWGKYKAMKEYNPHCDLFWVREGTRITKMPGGFATKADSGDLCSGFIRDVLNIHMHNLIQEGFLETTWQDEYETTETIDCNTYQPFQPADAPSTDGTRRLRRGEDVYRSRSPKAHRELKGAKSSAAAGGAVASFGGDTDSDRLSVESMIGIFIFHWGVMAFALLIAVVKGCFVDHGEKEEGGASERPALTSKKQSFTTDRSFSNNQEDELQHLRIQLTTMHAQLNTFEQKMVEQQEKSQQQQLLFQQHLLRVLERRTVDSTMAIYPRDDEGQSPARTAPSSLEVGTTEVLGSSSPNSMNQC